LPPKNAERFFNTFVSNNTIGLVSMDSREEKKEEYYKGKEVKGEK
jgi:hypothetical protein